MTEDDSLKALVTTRVKSKQRELQIVTHLCGKGLASVHNHLIDVDFFIGINIEELVSSR